MLVVDFQLAETLLELFFFPDSSYYNCYPFRHVKTSTISIDRVIAHLEGKASIGAPSIYDGLAKVIAIDLDVLDKAIASKVIQALDQNGIPAYASFSGRKGYHIHIFLKESPLHTVQTLSAKVKKLLDSSDIAYDKIYPSPTGKGGGCIRLPLGVHPETGNPCHLLNERMEPVEDPLAFLLGVETIDCNQDYYADVETGEILGSRFPETISRRPCINKLWRDGLQQANTRHSATCVIANATRRCVQIPQQDKENALVDWVARIFPKAKAAGLISEQTDLKYAVYEARRLWHDFYSRASYGDSCDNPAFKHAMRSACEDEFACQLRLNRNDIDIDLLRRLKVFNAPNAKPPGIGKTAMNIYLVMADIAQQYPAFEWKGMVAFSVSNPQLVELANCSERTIKTHKKRLIELGMVLRLPKKEIPEESLFSIPYPYQPNFYALPKLTEERIRRILAKLRDLGKGGRV